MTMTLLAHERKQRDRGQSFARVQTTDERSHAGDHPTLARVVGEPSTLSANSEGKRALLASQRVVGNRATLGLVQAKRHAAGENSTLVPHEVAAQGLTGTGGPLPFLDRIQTSFGGHDVSTVRAHVGGVAAEASKALGAEAYATNESVAFQSSPSLYTAAHEAAHVIQQRAGVNLPDGMGRVGDPYEQHADAIAAKVVRGEPCEALLEALPNASRDRSDLDPRAEFQRTVGNSPVVQLSGTPETTTLPTAEELTARIVRCIGVWETARGRDEPRPRESDLRTVAGVRASMKSIVQTTMPNAMTTLRAHPELWPKASPPLTQPEINAAEARCRAVTSLLDAVATAAGADTKSEDFIKAQSAAISATGLSNDDVKTMFSAVELKSTVDAARQRVSEESGNAAREKKIKEEAAAIPADKRMGLPTWSLTSYIRSEIWAEHKAAWQRKAVAAMANDVGKRIEDVVVFEHAVPFATIQKRPLVDTELAKTPVPSEENIVKTVAQKNNPREVGYANGVWATYQRLYPKPKPPPRLDELNDHRSGCRMIPAP